MPTKLAQLSFWNFRKNPNTIARCYFFDAQTNEELLSGMCLGTDCSGIWNGARFTNTSMGVDCVAANGLRMLVNADHFPGRSVIVKIWYSPSQSEYVGLVSRSKGWAGNEASHVGERRTTHPGVIAATKRVFAARGA